MRTGLKARESTEGSVAGPMSGRLLPERSIRSVNLDAPRIVRLYLPPSYTVAPRRRFPVLYVHDGQNVFSSAGPDAAFGWGGWNLDETIDHLVATNRMEEVILVAIDNSRFRYQEYRGPAYPYRAEELERLRRTPPGAANNRRHDQYARFLVEELKPAIDAEFRTRPGPKQTALLGSSMGGICSLALAWAHPEIFGGAASLSGAFQVEKQHFLQGVLRSYTGPPKPIRIYLDSGIMDHTGDDDGRRITEQVAGELRRIGWRRNLSHWVEEHVLTEEEMGQVGLRPEKWVEARHSQHNEFYWRLRAWRALTFLFPSRRQARGRVAQD